MLGYLLVGNWQVFLQGQHVLPTAHCNEVGVGKLAAGRVATDQGLPQVQGPQQVGNGRFLGAFGRHFFLTQHQRMRRSLRADDTDAAFLGPGPRRPPQHVAVHAHRLQRLFNAGQHLRRPSVKTASKSFGVYAPKNPRERVVRRNPVGYTRREVKCE